MRSYLLATVFDLVFGLVSLLIYYFISRTFHNVTTRDLSGAPSYFAFASVGVALSIVVQGAAVRLAQRFREDQLTGLLETLVAQPVTATELSLGASLFQFVFATLRGLLYLIVAGLWLGVGLSHADWLGLLLVLFATVWAMAAIAIALASFVLLLRRAEFLVGVAALALGLGGGAFFPIAVLPGWIQPVAKVLPTRFIFGGVRSSFLRGEGWGMDLAYLALFSAVALPVAIGFFKLTLEWARRRGRLSTY